MCHVKSGVFNCWDWTADTDIRYVAEHLHQAHMNTTKANDETNGENKKDEETIKIRIVHSSRARCVGIVTITAKTSILDLRKMIAKTTGECMHIQYQNYRLRFQGIAAQDVRGTGLKGKGFSFIRIGDQVQDDHLTCGELGYTNPTIPDNELCILIVANPMFDETYGQRCDCPDCPACSEPGSTFPFGRAEKT